MTQEAGGLHTWRHPSILATGTLAAAAGFAQFGVAAALADVAASFGEPQPEIGVTGRAGLAGTTLGIGLGIIRLASLGALPLAALADRAGRRRVLLTASAIGLAFTAAASLSPTYWWFVAIFAMGRPLLSATNAVAVVVAAEETRSADRSKAVALIGAAYGVGAGLTAIIRGAWSDQLGFRGLFALAVVPLVLLPIIGRWLEEPSRYGRLAAGPRRPVLASVPAGFRNRLLLLVALTAGIALVAGPANTYLFYFAESVEEIAPSTLAVVVVLAGPTGLVGLLAGRWAADRLGRRITAGAALAAVAVAGVVTYNLGSKGVIGGYLFGILGGGVYTPASGALTAELFPTSFRATASGWLTASSVAGAVAGIFGFGALADRLGGFGPAAVALFFVPVVVALLYALLPETKDQELEQTAPEPERP